MFQNTWEGNCKSPELVIWMSTRHFPFMMTTREVAILCPLIRHYTLSTL